MSSASNSNSKDPLQKLRVAILFGGQSAEHEISLQSAKNVVDALDREKYEPILIGINKKGTWHLNLEAEQLLLGDDSSESKGLKLKGGSQLATSSGGRENFLVSMDGIENSPKIDVVFPILHGPFGEDGSMQGLLKLSGLPFVGSGVLGSAVGMDKEISKLIFKEAGIPVTPSITLKKHNWRDFGYDQISDGLGKVVFVKPANMGSSVGVSKATNSEEFLTACELAFKYDRKVLVEKEIKGREIECAVLGNHFPKASCTGEIRASHGFYSYEAKYIDEKGAELDVPANIDEAISEQIREYSIKAFQSLGCEGLARCDFFLTPSGEIFINEVNTMPGFTKISMYSKMWEASGISYSELIDRLIQLAVERHNEEQELLVEHEFSVSE